MALKLVYPNGKPIFNPEKIAYKDENASWNLWLCTSQEIDHPFLFIDLKIRNTHLLPEICIKDPIHFNFFLIRLQFLNSMQLNVFIF
ncbi:hypothetical protein [Leptospira interrogans]|uniref:hypothetical protein n=1 Tax=Leptospira interrogans TaxID=173 RepID=UPI000A512018|nr:hypothetical protein [Leptospira interrogans]